MTLDLTNLTNYFAPIVEKTLRERVALPQWVDADFGIAPTDKGDTIPFKRAGAVVTRDVTPGSVAAATSVTTSTQDTLVVDIWREAPFRMTYKQLQEQGGEFAAQQMAESVRAIVNYLDTQLLTAAYTHAYQHYSAGGTNLSSFTNSSAPLANSIAQLDNAVAPEDDRTFVFDPDVKGNINQNTQYVALTNNQPRDAMVDGNMGRLRDNVRMHWSQNIPTVYFAGNSNTTGVANATVGATSVTMFSTTSQVLKAGQLFGIASDGTYVVTSDASMGPAGATVSVLPLVRASSASANATFPSAATVDENLVLQKGAIKLVVRPGVAGPSDTVITDPVSGLPVVLTVREEHGQQYVSASILAGIKVLRPEFLVRVQG
jgi:hypothetical protein